MRGLADTAAKYRWELLLFIGLPLLSDTAAFEVLTFPIRVVLLIVRTTGVLIPIPSIDTFGAFSLHVHAFLLGIFYYFHVRRSGRRTLSLVWAYAFAATAIGAVAAWAPDLDSPWEWLDARRGGSGWGRRTGMVRHSGVEIQPRPRIPADRPIDRPARLRDGRHLPLGPLDRGQPNLLADRHPRNRAGPPGGAGAGPLRFDPCSVQERGHRSVRTGSRDDRCPGNPHGWRPDSADSTISGNDAWVVGRVVRRDHPADVPGRGPASRSTPGPTMKEAQPPGGRSGRPDSRK